MALEPITRQEQIIAGKDLEPITRMEKFLKEYGGGGGASSWNDLDDRPFGEETTYSDTLTWDGNTDGRYMVEFPYGVCCKVHDATPTLEDLKDVTYVDSEGIGELDSNAIHSTNGLIALGSLGFIIEEKAVGLDFNGITFAEAGLYFNKVNGTFVSSLTINGYNGFETKVVKPIDNKYLEPFETVGGDTLTWDGNTEGLESFDGVYFKVSNHVLTAEDLANGGTVNSAYGDSVSFTAEGVVPIDGVGLLIMEFALAGADGIYLLNAGVDEYISSLTINGYTGFTTTKLKEEYIPVDYIKQLIAEVTGN